MRYGTPRAICGPTIGMICIPRRKVAEYVWGETGWYHNRDFAETIMLWGINAILGLNFFHYTTGETSKQAAVMLLLEFAQECSVFRCQMFLSIPHSPFPIFGGQYPRKCFSLLGSLSDTTPRAWRYEAVEITPWNRRFQRLTQAIGLGGRKIWSMEAQYCFTQAAFWYTKGSAVK